MARPTASDRHLAVSELAGRLVATQRCTPLRVGIDGRTASGKTTLADELASALADLGATTVRTSIDGFHRPRAERYRKGRFSAEGYLDDARDWTAIRQQLLDPLGPGGSRRYVVATFDLERDVPLEPVMRDASERTILIVDGSFLQRPELAEGWDAVVFVDVPEPVAVRRGVARDARPLGGEVEALRIHLERYQAAFALYEARYRPRDRAHFVWTNDPPEAPVLRPHVPPLG